MVEKKEQRRENVRGSQSHWGEVKHVVLCCCWENKRNCRGVGKSVGALGRGTERTRRVKGAACDGDGEREWRVT